MTLLASLHVALIATILGVVAVPVKAQTLKTPQTLEELYPLDEAVAAFRRVKPWIYFCQTQQIRNYNKGIAISAAIAIPVAILILKTTRSLTGEFLAWSVGDEVIGAMISSIWLLSRDANKQAHEQEKQVRANNLDWIKRIYELPDAEKDEIINQLVSSKMHYLTTFYSLTPQEATEMLAASQPLRALTIRLGEVYGLLKKKKKLYLCGLDSWAEYQHSFATVSPPAG